MLIDGKPNKRIQWEDKQSRDQVEKDNIGKWKYEPEDRLTHQRRQLQRKVDRVIPENHQQTWGISQEQRRKHCKAELRERRTYIDGEQIFQWEGRLYPPHHGNRGKIKIVRRDYCKKVNRDIRANHTSKR